MIRLDHGKFDELEVTAILGDEWKKHDWCEINKDVDTYTDDSWKGCDFRYLSQAGCNDEIACNVIITGRKSIPTGTGNYKTRVSIEIVGDGMPSAFFGGIVYHNNQLVA